MSSDPLLTDLRKAHELARQFTGGYSERFMSAKDFTSALGEAITELENGNAEVLKDIQLWFLPTSDWDDFVKMEGLELAERISGMVRSRAN